MLQWNSFHFTGLEMDSKKIDLFENSSIPAAVAKLAIPSVLACIVMILYNLADTFFVGMLNDPLQTASVSLAAPALLAFNAVNNLFGVGGASLMSRSFGKRDYETAGKTSAFSFYLALACSVAISALYLCFKTPVLRLLGADSTTASATAEYLKWTVALGAIPAIMNMILSNLVRSEGSALQASIGVISGALLNTVLDPFFVLPQFLGMGAAGAGCATFISNCFAMLYLLSVIFIRRKETAISLNPGKFSFDGYISREVFGVGVPAAIQNLLNVTGSLILNNFTAQYGAAAVSAMGIAHKANLLPLYITMGITQGVMPFIGYNYSSGDRRRMKDAILCVLRITVVITLVMAAVYFFLSGELIALFMKDAEVVKHGGILLREMAVGIPFLALDFMVVAVFQATGKGKYSLIFALCRKLALEIPAIILFNRLQPLYGMGWSQPAAEFVLSVAALIMLVKIFRENPDTGAGAG